jgi:hypothetical protein
MSGERSVRAWRSLTCLQQETVRPHYLEKRSVGSDVPDVWSRERDETQLPDGTSPPASQASPSVPPSSRGRVHVRHDVALDGVELFHRQRYYLAGARRPRPKGLGMHGP